jgi:hypothetical protein
LHFQKTAVAATPSRTRYVDLEIELANPAEQPLYARFIVTIGTDVGKNYLLPMTCCVIFYEIHGGFVGQMAESAANSVFNVVRALPIDFKQMIVVI